jgi:hypothetical protein
VNIMRNGRHTEQSPSARTIQSAVRGVVEALEGRTLLSTTSDLASPTVRVGFQDDGSAPGTLVSLLVTLPENDAGGLDLRVNWGDGAPEQLVSGFDDFGHITDGMVLHPYAASLGEPGAAIPVAHVMVSERSTGRSSSASAFVVPPPPSVATVEGPATVAGYQATNPGEFDSMTGASVSSSDA